MKRRSSRASLRSRPLPAQGGGRRPRQATFAHADRQQLLARLVTAQEEERRRVSRELHDRTAQVLAALLLGLDALHMESRSRRRTLKLIANLRATVESLNHDLLRIAIDLRPTSLDDLGLRAALLSHIEAWSKRTGIKTDVRMTGVARRRLPEEIETALYRIIQEALTNVVRHARASSVSVRVSVKAGEVIAIVADEGSGSRPTGCCATHRLQSVWASSVCASAPCSSVASCRSHRRPAGAPWSPCAYRFRAPRAAACRLAAPDRWRFFTVHHTTVVGGLTLTQAKTTYAVISTSILPAVPYTKPDCVDSSAEPIGSAVRWRRFGKIELVATTPVKVLITGESGVGKELVALLVHQLPATHKHRF